MAEMERDIAQTIYGNLKDFKIEMPHNYIGGSGGGDSGKLTRLVVGWEVPVYCCDFLLLPIASCCSQCLLLVSTRFVHTQQ